jgi:hypothetical protein
MPKKDNIAPFVFRKGRALYENEPRNMVLPGSFAWHEKTKKKEPLEPAEVNLWATAFANALTRTPEWVARCALVGVALIILGSVIALLVQLLKDFWPLIIVWVTG